MIPLLLVLVIAAFLTVLFYFRFLAVLFYFVRGAVDAVEEFILDGGSDDGERID